MAETVVKTKVGTFFWNKGKVEDEKHVWGIERERGKTLEIEAFGV